MCVPVNKITIKVTETEQIVTETPNFAFYVGMLYRYCLKYFYGQIICMQGCTKEFENITVYGRNYFLEHFSAFKTALNMMKWLYIFDLVKKHAANILWNKLHSELVCRVTKKRKKKRRSSKILGEELQTNALKKKLSGSVE